MAAAGKPRDAPFEQDAVVGELVGREVRAHKQGPGDVDVLFDDRGKDLLPQGPPHRLRRHLFGARDGFHLPVLPDPDDVGDEPVGKVFGQGGVVDGNRERKGDRSEASQRLM
ncbi:hypothetical protein GCM10028895_51220 [Pontibacter rugosus]